ncbi:Uncharacterized membrane protein YeiB [Nonomuraea solani]|uniref:Uncharacterized membrane protein YeiB n=1 Tax=Nonomuraea solani TaxID=1144553 RepID=A0A1H6E6Y6_9ACTN|nr:DUF418 domain-containing protein [Nonomuraea solani]SEG93013.1 Uncharacterized membrane protein YeiB [Nonomuraea solani]
MSTSIQARPRTITGRALAPDLARGAMLLAIAFAHAPLFVTDVSRGPTVLNTVAEMFHLFFVGNHARPMFAFLFGYALVQLLDRRLSGGADWVSARRLLRRRGWWLVLIGFVHVALLVPIDILAAYGLSAVLVTGLLRRGDRALLWTAGLTLVPATLIVGFGMWFPLSRGMSTYTAGSVAAGGQGFWELFTNRMAAWPLMVIFGVVLVVPGMLVGMWAARRRFLEEPARHRRFLVRAAVITTALSVAGALPAALIQAGLWAGPPGAAMLAASFAQPLTGYAGGIGMAAIIGLVAIAAGRRRNRFTTSVEALGQRSLSMYLFQSIVFTALFYPFGLGLQDDLGLAGATAVATGTWLVSLLLADLMRRAGHRGPAEILLRRLTYASGPR